MVDWSVFGMPKRCPRGIGRVMREDGNVMVWCGVCESTRLARCFEVRVEYGVYLGKRRELVQKRTLMRAYDSLQA